MSRIDPPKGDLFSWIYLYSPFRILEKPLLSTVIRCKKYALQKALKKALQKALYYYHRRTLWLVNYFKTLRVVHYLSPEGKCESTPNGVHLISLDFNEVLSITKTKVSKTQFYRLLFFVPKILYCADGRTDGRKSKVVFKSL